MNAKQAQLFANTPQPVNAPQSVQEVVAKMLANLPHETEAATIALRDAVRHAQSFFKHRMGKRICVFHYRNRPSEKLAHYEFECANKSATSRMMNKHKRNADCCGYAWYGYPTKLHDTVSFLEELGFTIDYADPADFAPDLPIGTGFAVKRNHTDEINELWIYQGVYNAQRGADEAELRFQNINEDCNEFLMRGKFEAMLAEQRAVMLTEAQTEQRKQEIIDWQTEYPHSEYGYRNAVKVRVLTQGGRFVVYHDNGRVDFFDTEAEVAKCLEYYWGFYPKLKFQSGKEDLLQADQILLRTEKKKQALRAMLPAEFQKYFDVVQDILPNHFCELDTLQPLFKRFQDLLDAAFADAYTMHEFSERVLNNGFNNMLRRIFDLKTGLTVYGTTQSQGKALVREYIIRTFGTSALDEIARKKAEEEAQRAQQRQADALKRAYAIMDESYKSFVLKAVTDGGWRIEQRQQGKLNKLVYTNGESYLIHKRKSHAYKSFYDFMKQAFTLYGSMEKALAAVGTLPQI